MKIINILFTKKPIKTSKQVSLLKLIYATLTFILIFANSSSPSYAQANLDLTVSPPISYLHVPQGSSRVHTVVITNNNDQEVIVTPKLLDFKPNGASGQAVILNQLTCPYIKLNGNLKNLTIPAHKKAQLDLYIDVPKDAEDREYPLSIIFLSNSLITPNFNQQLRDSLSQITGGVASNLVILVAKDNKLENQLKIQEIKTTKIVDSFSKLNFTPIANNLGISAQLASGSAKILNYNNEVVSEFTIYPDMVLGNSTRNLRASISAGIDQVVKPTHFNYKPRFLFGPYKIMVTLNNSTNEYNTVIYAFPIWGVLIIISGVTLAIIYARKHQS